MRVIRQGCGLYFFFKNSVWRVGWFKSLPKKPDPEFKWDAYKYFMSFKSVKKDKKQVRKKATSTA